MSNRVNKHVHNHKKKESKTVRTIKDITSGIIGGICQTLAGQPFDTVKIRLQTQSHLYSRGALQCLSSIIRHEGIFTLYQGTLSPLISASICAGIQFSTNEATQRFFGGTDNLNFSQLYMCGFMAGLANSPVVTPAELVRIRMQVQNKSSPLKPGEKHYTGSIDAFMKILKEDGIGALYRGHVLTMMRESFGFGFFFGAYHLSRRWQAQRNEDHILKTYQILLSGSLAGLSFWVPMFPIDVIKSKIQVDTQYKNVIDCVQHTYKVDGIKGFYRGFAPCALRSVPVNAFVFLGFEISMRILG